MTTEKRIRPTGENGTESEETTWINSSILADSPEYYTLPELTRPERRLAMFTYSKAYEWGVSDADPLDDAEKLADYFAEVPWLLLDLERDAISFTPRQAAIFWHWVFAGIRSAQYVTDERSRENHRRFAQTVHQVANSRFASYADLEAYRRRARAKVVANV